MTQISKKNMRKNYKSNKNKSKKKGNVLKGGAREPLNDIYPLAEVPRRRPQWINCRAGSCSTIVRVPGLQLYGTSLPIWNQWEMENIFRFYLFRKDINRVISLHACATPQGVAAHNDSCRPPYNPNNNLENDTFATQKHMSPRTRGLAKVQFIDIFIEDMTPGTLVAWEALTRYRFSTLDEKTIIHCLAGFGRTGTALLFYVLYYKLNIFDILLNEFFNRVNSQGMYNYIITLMQQNIVLDVDAENNPYNDPGPDNIGRFNPAYLISETTKIIDPGPPPDPLDIFHANLLISRINYCILWFAHHHCLAVDTPIYLYPTLTIGDVVTQQTIFQPMAVNYVPATLFDQAFLNAVFVVP